MRVKTALVPFVGAISIFSCAAFADFFDSSQKHYLAGDNPAQSEENHGVWAMGFGHHVRQKAQDLTAGYLAHTFGGGFGLDWRSSESLILGGGIRFDATDLDSTGYTGIDQYFTSTRAMLYGRYDLTDCWYANALVSFGFNEYDTNRLVFTFPVPGQSAAIIDVHGDTHGNQWVGQLSTGYQIALGKWLLLPELAVQYTNLHLYEYTERGVVGANIAYPSQNFESLKWSGDLILSRQNEFTYAQLLPYLHAKFIYDSENDAHEQFADVLGGPTAFATFGPKPSRSATQVGAGFTLFGQHNVQVTMRYDYTFKHHYRENAALLYVRNQW